MERLKSFPKKQINARKEFLVFQQINGPGLSKTTGEHYGNSNFFIVFDQKPLTKVTSSEVNASYGHQWTEAKILFRDVQQEQLRKGRNHGKYSGFFRGQVIDFCTRVVDCNVL